MTWLVVWLVLQLYPYTIRFTGQEGGVMRIAQPGILVEPWNPVAGTNWVYDAMPQQATAVVRRHR